MHDMTDDENRTIADPVDLIVDPVLDVLPQLVFVADGSSPGYIAFKMNGVDRLKIEMDAFHVDGVRVNDDPEKVYEALSAWLSAAINPQKGV